MDSHSRTDKQIAEVKATGHDEDDGGIYYIPNSQPQNLNDVSSLIDLKTNLP